MWPGNTKRAIYILQNALELGARPKELLETALQSMQGGKTNFFCSEDKENIHCEGSLIIYILSFCFKDANLFHALFVFC